MKNISISIAFILSALALACLSGASYLGSVLDQTAPLEAAMRAGGFFVAGIIASLVAIHAKKMRPDVKRWRLIELFCVAVMILVAAALSSGAVFGINFLSSSASLRREARQDIKALENEIATFRQKASEELQVTVTGLSNLYRYHSTDYGNVDAAVKVFVRSKVLYGQAARTLSPASIRGYQTHMQECIDRLSTDPYINRADAFSEALANCHRMVEEWKPDQVAELADSLNAVALRVAL
ncbi:MAG: hypothetical protein K2F79_08000, partial [Muribaculaceae bacterium]|nr:hypothetical protein [Muribaculaceae bacterium]